MRRVVSVWFPHWPTDRLRQSPDPARPVVTALHDGHRRVVGAVDPAAQALGLRPGMALAHVTAMVPGLTVQEGQPDADADALRRLAAWCHRYAPLTAPDPPDGLWLDVTGCAHLFRGEAALLDVLARRFAGDGLHTGCAVADTPGAAHAVARHGGGVVLAGAHRDALAALPVAALRLGAELVATLRRLGIERVAHLERLPRAALARRFGPHLLLRLDQAHGRVHEPILPLVPEELPQHRITFLEPLLTAAALSIAVQHLVAPMCNQMERAGLGARRLDLLFERVDGGIQAVRIGTGRPSRNIRHLSHMLAERLEEVDPGLGIEAMQLVISLAEPLAWQQDAAGPSRPDISALVDRLSNRLGADQVFRAEPVESDVPERSVRQVPALSRPGGAGWPSHWPAPVRLLHPPQPVEALAALPDGAPAAFTWRRRRHRVRHADGPERIYGEWWLRDGEVWAVRDYFRVEDGEGARFWLFRRGDGADPATGGLEWFLHGLF
ncbi:MAG TPA: DNA polymerase Y family protein [Acetobacteraceae bacterium]